MRTHRDLDAGTLSTPANTPVPATTGRTLLPARRALQLGRESLRVLGAAQLAQVRGGVDAPRDEEPELIFQSEAFCPRVDP